MNMKNIIAGVAFGLAAPVWAAPSAVPETQSLRLAIEDLSRSFPAGYQRGAEFLKRLDSVKDEAEFKALQREALLANPLLDFDRLLVVKRLDDPSARPKGKMNVGHALGLPQNWQSNASLEKTAYDNEIAVLTSVRSDSKLTTLFRPASPAFVGDMDLNFAGDRLLFSMPVTNGWQVWEIKVDGTGLRQLTPNIPKIDNYDGCYLPDDKVIFNSTMNIHGVPCVGGGDKVGNLCRMDTDGKNVRMLTFEQDQDWYPRVLNDGRVMYTRWEYSDTPHYHTRLLMSMNPDGTSQLAMYGSNSYWPNSIFYARPIPGSTSQVIAVISGHHGVARMGELVLFDTAKGRAEVSGAVQRIPGYGKAVQPIIADQLVDQVWPKFLHPYPLSDKYFLVACKLTAKDPWGIYLVDIFDNMVPLRVEPGYALLEPIPLKTRPKPPIIPDRVRPGEKTGTVFLTDVYEGPGLKDVPRGTVTQLRLYAFHFAYWGMGGHYNIGVDGPWDGRQILGTVPVCEDGSANFKVPANTPIAIQPLNERGEALALMRSWFVTMPGENASCVGCHESVNSGPPAHATKAMQLASSEIKPWYGPARPFSFRREVQPVLDKFCVGCHNGVETSGPDFSGKRKTKSGFDTSYLALMPYVRRPGPESDFHVLTPLEYHVSTSELFQMLRQGHHNVKLDTEAWDRLTTWADLNVPDHGTWGEHKKGTIGEPARLRQEYRKQYANLNDDPETYPTPEPSPVAFVKPEPERMVPPSQEKAGGWPFDTVEAQRRQAAAGKPKQMMVEVGKNKLELELIPAGEFLMGEEVKAKRAQIAKPFYMMKSEVSNALFHEFDPLHDSRTIDMYAKDHVGPGPSVNKEEQPVVRVSWQKATAFCEWLSKKTGRQFSLPTEAQWEYACRAGTATPMWFGSVTDNFAPFANLADASLRKGLHTVVPWIPSIETVNDGAAVTWACGKGTPNAWGLADMHGNAAEWTASADPDGNKVVRGGSFWDRPERAQAASRRSYEPWRQVFDVGFRIICQD